MGSSFSVVAIARNEAKTLPRLIASLAEFQASGGEIVICDTGSTDGTPDIARSLGCDVHEVGERFLRRVSAADADGVNALFLVEGDEPILKATDTVFDFGAARNCAASFASHDLIAMADCDEAFTRLDLAHLNERIAAGAEQFDYPFVWSHDEQGAPLIGFRQSKFYDRRKLHWSGIIHEHLAGSARIEALSAEHYKLEHWGNAETDRSGYLRGLALDCMEHPDNDRHSHYFGRELMFRGRYRSAIRELQRHVAMDRWPAERAQSLVYIGDCYKKLGQPVRAIASWQSAIGVEARIRIPWLRLAQHYFSLGAHQHTASYAAAALAVQGMDFYSRDERDYTDVPHHLLYWALWYLGDKEGARTHYEKARAYRPWDSRYIHDESFFRDEPSVPPQVSARIEDLKKKVSGIQSWLDDEGRVKLYHLARFDVRTPTIVELGAWKGRSTVWLAAALQDRGGGQVFAVDTWKGTENEAAHAELLKDYGPDDLFNEFWWNITSQELSALVTPIQKKTDEAARHWTAGPIGLLFIDADHEYEAVKRDFELWSPHVESGGYIVFDDVPSWPGPTRLASELPSSYRRVRTSDNHYVVQKT